jgi:hypothetical protein
MRRVLTLSLKDGQPEATTSSQPFLWQDPGNLELYRIDPRTGHSWLASNDNAREEEPTSKIGNRKRTTLPRRKIGIDGGCCLTEGDVDQPDRPEWIERTLKVSVSCNTIKDLVHRLTVCWVLAIGMEKPSLSFNGSKSHRSIVDHSSRWTLSIHF